MDVRFRVWASGFQGLPIKVSAVDKAAVKKGLLGGLGFRVQGQGFRAACFVSMLSTRLSLHMP